MNPDLSEWTKDRIIEFHDLDAIDNHFQYEIEILDKHHYIIKATSHSSIRMVYYRKGQIHRLSGFAMTIESMDYDWGWYISDRNYAIEGVLYNENDSDSYNKAMDLFLNKLTKLGKQIF